MIIELSKGKVKIQPMLIPEMIDHTFIQYVYEANTSHLKPRLYINQLVFTGDKVFIDMLPGLHGNQVKVKVELLDGQGRVIRTYENDIGYYKYHVLGTKPIRPDIEVYVHNLHKQMEELRVQHQQEKDELNLIIKNLEEKGEVI